MMDTLCQRRVNKRRILTTLIREMRLDCLVACGSLLLLSEQSVNFGFVMKPVRGGQN